MDLEGEWANCWGQISVKILANQDPSTPTTSIIPDLRYPPVGALRDNAATEPYAITQPLLV